MRMTVPTPAAPSTLAGAWILALALFAVSPLTSLTGLVPAFPPGGAEAAAQELPWGAAGAATVEPGSALPAPTAVSRDTTAQGLKILTIDEYALWRSVGAASLSPDGRWVSYAYSQREMDDSLFIKPLAGGDPHVVVRGSDPKFFGDSRWVAYFVNPKEEPGGRAGAAPSGGGPAAGAPRAGGSGGPRALVLFDLRARDSIRWESVESFAFADAGRALVLRKRLADSSAEHKGADLVIRHLESGEEELLAYVNEFALDKVGRRLAYTLDTPEGESNGVHLLDLTTRARRVLDSERKVTYARLTWGDDRRKPSSDALAVLKGEEDEDLVERVNALLLWPALSRSTEAVVLDPRPVKGDSTGAEGAGQEGVGVVGASWTGGEGGAGAPAVAGAAGGAVPGAARAARVPDPFPEGWVLSEGGALRWAPDASRIFVATKPQLPAPKTLCKPENAETAGRGAARPGTAGAAADSTGAADPGSPGAGAETSDAAVDTAGAATPKIANMATRVGPDGRPLGPEEVLDGTCPEFVADVDIWHVQDRDLQSVQIVRANRDRGRTYMGVVHLEGRETQPTPRFVQLADTTMESVELSANGRYAMGKDPRPYASDWEPSYADVYRVDLSTGERTLVLEKHLRTLGFSPRGDHYLYWKDGHVWSYGMAGDRHVNLTEAAPVSFVNEEFDRMGEKPPHGIAGWTMDSTSVILQHRYDLWLQPLSGETATNLTRGVGAEQEMQLRILDLEPDEDLTDLRKPQVLTAFGQWTKKAGFYRLQGDRLQELVLADGRFGRVAKADSADVLLYTREDFRTFPDYLVSGLDFADPVKVTDANPQQAEYNWGTRILFDYSTTDGVRLQGILAIPDDYQPGEKRPMLVDFYEKMSQNLHAYPAPIYRDTPMVAGYVSAGYLVLLPDVHFRLGATHSQMLESINLAIDEVEKMGYVDPERIGLHGHSFSGQGAAYIATRSDRFAAIVPGAAATNLVSDFNQLWKSSGTNQHGYDTYGQGRFGTNPYDDLHLFLDQSATPNAATMNTPLLILHGTADGSVEWLQAVEFFNGLRWFGKNVILASYPGEPHHLTKYENQKDFQIRMRQFYDHYLRDRLAPRWMTDGRPFLQKERDLEMMKANQGGGSGGGSARPGGGG
jgi:hypothetical protein